MSNRCLSLVHPASNPNSRQAALALAEAGWLKEIITTIAYNPQGSLSKYLHFLPSKIRDTIIQELKRRMWTAPAGGKMRSHPWKEAARLALTRTNHALGFSSSGLVNWVHTSLDFHVAKHHLDGLDAIYSYEDVSATTFQVAKQRGILCLYDLPIPFYRMIRDIHAQEAELFPDLAPALQAIQEPAGKINRKEQEIELADRIFVASSISKKSLLDAGVPPNKIAIIPYGAPLDYFHPQPKIDPQFRALFVGSLGVHKGVHYLLRAWKELKLSDAELLLVGKNIFPPGWLEQYEGVFQHIPSVPHAALNQYYSAASVLVFPSLVEGFGLVMLEAMACGIPVIATDNTASVDIITDGVEGFIVPIRDVEALKEKLEWCYSHPQELVKMGKAARQKAESFTWNSYRQNLATQIRKVLSPLQK
jgi:glycosyltransferase involved in cell wall biosynthesis